MASNLFTAFSWLSCTWDGLVSYSAPSSSKKHFNSECCQCQMPTASTLLLRLAVFLGSGMGCIVEWCTFLFKEIIYKDFYQHRTCKWLCLSSLYLVSLLVSGIGFFTEWFTSLYKEQLTVNFASWTHKGLPLSTIFSCPSCSVHNTQMVPLFDGFIWFHGVGFSDKWTVEDAIQKGNEQRV